MSERPHVIGETVKPTPIAMIKTTCHCGAVSIEIPRQPETITNCDCSICRRYGTLWAYYKQAEIKITAPEGGTQAYARGRKSIRFVRCSACGCVTHWEPVSEDRGDRVGVNARNFEPDQLGATRIRRLDGAVTEKYLD
jgi:hypothetical protein